MATCKISNLETALKLSKITGRPLEDFYNGIVPSKYEQDKEESVENKGEEFECSTSDNIPEIWDNEIEPHRRISIPVQI